MVTLHVRVWIEMQRRAYDELMAACHPPREGVD